MQHENPAHNSRPYIALLAELAVDFVIMYLVMYTMINSLANFHLNLNNTYMTLMMVAPMAIVMLVAMRGMFPSRARNWAIIAIAAVVFAGSYVAMREQTAIGNAEFIRAMVPHHSGAILMCREANISDGELADLCQRIIRGQQEEIDQMERILSRL